MRTLATRLILLLALLSAGCTGLPEGIKPVENFRLDDYLGKWYEIARLDHTFERGLSDVSAEYARRADGGVDVLNRGYDADKGKWKEAHGRAEFIDGPQVGSLRVTFFAPFYGGYHIVALDPNLRWSLVVGPSRNYLWILARQRHLSDVQKSELLQKATDFGFDTSKLIWVSHNRPDA